MSFSDRPTEIALGYDASCGRCTKIATEVGRVVGREINVLSLAHPRMTAWRDAALGPDAAWRPTLVEIRGDDVRAFTGLGIGRRLARSIGLRDSLKVLRVIGDLEQEQRRDAAGRAEWPMLSRSGFFRASIGATAALGFLGAGTANARPAYTRSGVYAVSSVEGAAEAVRRNVERVTATADFRNVVPPRLFNSVTSSARTVGSTSVDHVMNDGSALTATAVHDDESVVVVYEYTPVGAAAPVTTATEFRTDGDRLIRHATSRMGTTEREQTFSAAGALAQPLDCERCEVAPGSRSEQPCNACLEYNLTCVAQSCGGCAFAGDPIRVTACIGTLCAALVAETCCVRQGVVCQDCAAFSSVCPTIFG